MSEQNDDDTINGLVTLDDGDTLSMFESDVEGEESGVWKNFGRTRWRIRSEMSSHARKAAAKIDKRYDPIARAHGGTLPEAYQERRAIDVAVSLLADWEKQPPHKTMPEFGKGEFLPFTEDAVRRLLAVPSLVRLKFIIIVESKNFANYRAAEREVLEGNSAPTSVGPSMAVIEGTSG